MLRDEPSQRETVQQQGEWYDDEENGEPEEWRRPWSRPTRR